MVNFNTSNNFQNQITNEFFPTEMPADKSAIPVRAIQYLCKKNLSGFIKKAFELLDRKSGNNDNQRKFETSCYNSAAALSVIFLGVENAKKMIEQSKKKFSNTLQICKNDMEFPYKIVHLFAGIISSQINELEIFHTLHAAKRLENMNQLPGGYKDFFPHIKPHIDKMQANTTDEFQYECAKLLTKLDFPFNLAVINNLREEIVKNSQFLAEKSSFFYYITISRPLNSKGSEHTYEHVCSLEQFHKNNLPYFRLHHSWVGNVTLCDTITENAWNLKSTQSVLR